MGEQPVRRILVLPRLVDGGEELRVEALRRRGDVLEVEEQAAWLEQLEDLSIQRALAGIFEMVDRKRGNHSVESSELG